MWPTAGPQPGAEAQPPEGTYCIGGWRSLSEVSSATPGLCFASRTMCSGEHLPDRTDAGQGGMSVAELLERDHIRPAASTQQQRPVLVKNESEAESCADIGE